MIDPRTLLSIKIMNQEYEGSEADHKLLRKVERARLDAEADFDDYKKAVNRAMETEGWIPNRHERTKLKRTGRSAADADLKYHGKGYGDV